MRRDCSFCSARAANGHAAVAPPSTAMNSRLFIQSPRRRGRAALVEFRGRSPWLSAVDDKFELGRLQHRQIGGLLALEDPAGVDASLSKRIGDTGSVAH